MLTCSGSHCTVIETFCQGHGQRFTTHHLAEVCSFLDAEFPVQSRDLKGMRVCWLSTAERVILARSAIGWFVGLKSLTTRKQNKGQSNTQIHTNPYCQREGRLNQHPVLKWPPMNQCTVLTCRNKAKHTKLQTSPRNPPKRRNDHFESAKLNQKNAGMTPGLEEPLKKHYTQMCWQSSLCITQK